MNVLLLLLLAASNASPDGAVARVDGAVISAAALRNKISELRNRQDAGDAQRALDRLVDEALLAGEARRLGLDRDPAVTAAVDTETRRAAADRLVEREIAPATVAEETLLQIFHQSSDFARFEIVAFRSREEAQASLERIRQGATFRSEAPKALVARVYEKASEAPLTMRGAMERALADAVFQGAVGAVVGPSPLSEGWAVARVLEKQVGDAKAFAARRADIAEHARKQIVSESRAHLCKQLRAKAGVSLDDDFLRQVSSTAPSQADLDHVVATVSARSVRYRDIFPSVRSLAGERGGRHMAGPALKTQLAWQQVDAELLAEFAIGRGHASAPEVAARARTVLANAAAERTRSTTPAPSEDEIASYYRRNASRFGLPFERVLPVAATEAAAEKREAAVAGKVKDLRNAASISIDRAALERVVASGS